MSRTGGNELMRTTLVAERDGDVGTFLGTFPPNDVFIFICNPGSGPRGRQ